MNKEIAILNEPKQQSDMVIDGNLDDGLYSDVFFFF